MKTADKDYFLDADRNLVDDADSAAFVLIREGQEIPPDMAEQYGLGKVAQPEETAETETVEKSAKPSANKSAKPAQNKGVK
jgi:hypothetical protein